MMRIRDFSGNRRLLDLLRKRDLPQAALFAGPSGLGKKTLAKLLAALANCKDPKDFDLCGQCSGCIKAEANIHSDIRVLQPEPNVIKIDSIRNLNREAQFRPFEGRLKFFIVDQAEKMQAEAANAILKTLEEPADTTRIILITAFPHQLPATIRSRCQTFQFGPLNSDELLRCLDQREGLSKVELRAQFAGGSVGKAIEMKIDEVEEARDLMLEILEGWLRHNSFEYVFSRSDLMPLREHLKQRDSTLKLLEMLELIGLDLYYYLVDTPHRVVNRDCRERLRKIGCGLSLQWLFQFLTVLADARRDVDRQVRPLVCFQTLWLETRDPRYKNARSGYG